MDKTKQNNGPQKKEVSKKDRRAPKIQERNKQQPPTSKTQAPACDAAKNVQKQLEPPASTQLSEKEQRRLEWQKKLVEQKSESDKNENVSKAELRAKRREQQEAQRSAKVSTKPEPKLSPKSEVKVAPKKVEKKKPADTNRLQIVSHLYSDTKFGNTIVNYKNVHPAFVRLGVQYSTNKILGSNARCRALLAAFKCLIHDLQTPPKQEFCRYLQTILEPCEQHLQNCRPFAVTMTNALRHFKTELNKSETGSMTKQELMEKIDTYVAEEIIKADEAISLKVNEKISDGDVILTYGCSSLVRRILSDAHTRSKQFEVIVVDGRPFLEGRQMLQRLVQLGISCSYVQINAISYVMSLATKVLLGAHALLTNGYVMSRIGTAQVALVAQAYNKPVLVCCETYKFSERVLTDSFVYNELGDGNMLISTDTLDQDSPLVKARSDANLKILNLLYDVTPPDLITAVVTEIAILPCTSAPVVLRIKP